MRDVKKQGSPKRYGVWHYPANIYKNAKFILYAGQYLILLYYISTLYTKLFATSVSENCSLLWNYNWVGEYQCCLN